MLFLQGDRDRLAELDLLRPVCRGLGDRATLRVIAGADHGFHVLKRSGRDDAEVLGELADATAAWATDLEPDASLPFSPVLYCNAVSARICCTLLGRPSSAYFEYACGDLGRKALQLQTATAFRDEAGEKGRLAGRNPPAARSEQTFVSRPCRLHHHPPRGRMRLNPQRTSQPPRRRSGGGR